MVSTPDVLTDNISVSLSISILLNKPSTREPPLQFSDVLDVKPKTDVHILGAAKSK